MAAEDDVAMFRAPTARGMQTLDRSVFQKIVPLKAARVFDNKNIFKVRSALERSKDALQQERLVTVRADPDLERAMAGTKCILLRPEIEQSPMASNAHSDVASGYDKENCDASQVPESPQGYSSVLAELVKEKAVSLISFDLQLDYSYWTYHDIMSAILPTEALKEIPSGFSQVGHVAHLNLRDEYLQYKFLIAEILLDKNPNVRTVINKIDDVGGENEFRTFRYEVLAGPDDMQVEVSEENCTFVFDYSKVYWNTRLSTEHRRLVSMFKEGDAVCDVMAGIGPFAVPAGRKRVFVWANDLNPDSYASLEDAIKRNKVGDYVRPYNVDGRTFIRSASAQLLQSEHSVKISKKRSRKDPQIIAERARTIVQPKTFQHFVLNLPASALTFLSSFVGLYRPEVQRKLSPETLMPIVHVYCFSTKDELAEDSPSEKSETQERDTSAAQKICAEISRQLQYEMLQGKLEEGGVEIYDVRDVAPNKRMFCASFRLPAEVAFRKSCAAD